MKIKTKVLTTFLKKSRMEGSQQIDEAILKFDKDGLKIDTNSPSQLSRVMSWLKIGAFKEYEELGNVGLNDLSNVVKVLDRFGEFITIKKEGNLLTVNSEGKKVDIELVAESFLQGDTGAPELEDFVDTFSIKYEKVADVVKDVALNKDAEIIIETKPKVVAFSNTGKYKFLNTIDAPPCKGGARSKFGQPFVDAITNLDGELEFSVGVDYPIKIMEKLENSVVTIIVAPRVEDKD